MPGRPRTPDGGRRTTPTAPEYQQAAPRFAPSTIGAYFCTFFPPSIDPMVTITGKGAGPILVMGTTGDPATPLASTRNDGVDARGRPPGDREGRGPHRLRRQHVQPQT